MDYKQKLNADILWCERCPLHATRTNVVVGEGPLDATIVVIGEAPGANEDQEGIPFCGRSGNLLRELLEAAGLKDKVFITNIVKCRPPENRDPAPNEIVTCLMFLKRQIAIIKPKIIVGVGRISSQAIRSDFKMSEDNGKIFKLKNGMDFMGIYHPAYLLRDRSKIDVVKGQLIKLGDQYG